MAGRVQPNPRAYPDFAPKVLNTICTELGMDSMAAMYLSGKLKHIIQEKATGSR